MLSVNNVSLERYFEPVFQPVSFSVAAGEIILLTGDNGSGKTTLIKILAGILRPSQGELSKDAGIVTYLGHNLAVKDDMSVTENIVFMSRFFGGTLLNTSEIVERVGLSRVAEQAARTLSAGQRKRCALARLLFNPSGLWLLDEPYSNLDRNGIELLDSLLRSHIGSGGACVLTTHGSLRPEGFDLKECELVSGALTA